MLRSVLLDGWNMSGLASLYQLHIILHCTVYRIEYRPLEYYDKV